MAGCRHNFIDRRRDGFDFKPFYARQGRGLHRKPLRQISAQFRVECEETQAEYKNPILTILSARAIGFLP